MRKRVISYTELPDPKTYIRLIQIKPGKDDDPIECQLSAFEPSEIPFYAAISYTSGKPEHKRSIIVNGSRVRVGLNCFSALWQARQQLIAFYYWVDAICINQQDIYEKNWQVGMMGRIFANARLVLIPLGPLTGCNLFLYDHTQSAPPDLNRASWSLWFAGIEKVMGIEHLAELGQAVLSLSEKDY